MNRYDVVIISPEGVETVGGIGLVFMEATILFYILKHSLREGFKPDIRAI